MIIWDICEKVMLRMDPFIYNLPLHYSLCFVFLLHTKITKVKYKRVLSTWIFFTISPWIFWDNDMILRRKIHKSEHEFRHLGSTACYNFPKALWIHVGLWKVGVRFWKIVRVLLEKCRSALLENSDIWTQLPKF